MASSKGSNSECSNGSVKPYYSQISGGQYEVLVIDDDSVNQVHYMVYIYFSAYTILNDLTDAPSKPPGTIRIFRNMC